MNSHVTNRGRTWLQLPPGLALALLALIALGWMAGGCASSSTSSSMPKPGSGIAEYREVAGTAHEAVAATVKALETLAQPSTTTSLQHPALPGFDRAFHQLELTSIKARARAEAIMARGQAYFDEWQGNLAAMTNQAGARIESVRYARLHEHFERVRQRSGEVREEFRPFMSKLREFRARLDQPPTSPAAGGETPAQQREAVTASGRRVLKALESLSTALNEAEAELRAVASKK